MKHVFSLFVFVALLAFAGRAEAYDFTIGPDYGGVTSTSTSCATDYDCLKRLSAGQPNNRVYRCVLQSKATVKTCTITVVICGSEPETTVTYNQVTGMCEYTYVPCPAGTYRYVDKYGNPQCGECTHASHCDDGNACTTDTCSTGKKCVHTETNSTSGCCVHGEYYAPGQSFCGTSPDMPQEKSLGRERFTCSINAAGGYALVSNTCGHQWVDICENGECVPITHPCNSAQDCTAEDVHWCEWREGEWTYSGYYTYPLCSMNEHKCQVGTGATVCPYWIPIEQLMDPYDLPYYNACLCAQTGGTAFP